MAANWNDIVKELTCAICQDDFNDPRILPCSHCYCSKCIEQVSKFSAPSPFPCPECRRETELPSNDPSQLPRALLAVRIKQTLDKIPQDTGAKAAPVCPEHGEPKRLFCRSCDAQLCVKCMLHHHRDHYYQLAEDAAISMSKAIIEGRTELVQLKSSLLIASRANRNALGEVRERGDRLAETINTSFKELCNVLKQRRDRLLEEVSSFVQGKVNALDEQERSLQEMISKIQTANEVIDEVIVDRDVLLERHKSILSDINQKMEECARMNLEPVAAADINVTANICDKVAHFIDAEWKVRHDTHAVTSVKVVGIERLVDVMCPVSVTVNLQSTKPKDVIVSASISSADSSGVCEVFQKGDRTFHFSYCAVKRGHHTVNIGMNGEHVPGSPFAVLATIPPCKLGKLVRTVRLLHHPMSMAFGANDTLIVAEFSKISPRLTIIDRFGTNTSYITSQDIVCPMGLAVDAENMIYVTDSASNMVLKFDMKGTLVKKVGGCGSQHGQFNGTSDIIIVDDELFICDAGNHRIQVFDKSLNFCRLFGCYGNKMGELNAPTDLTYSKQMRQLFVVDSEGQCVQVFTPEGKPVNNFSIGTSGSLPSEFSGILSGMSGLLSNKERPFKPSAISLDKTEQFLFIGDRQYGRVVVLTTNGTYVTSFCSKGVGPGQLQQPTRITLDSEGYVYVCDSKNKCILVF